MVVVRMWWPKETTIGGSNRMQFANAPSISFGFLGGSFGNSVVARTELVSFCLVCGKLTTTTRTAMPTMFSLGRQK